VTELDVCGARDVPPGGRLLVEAGGLGIGVFNVGGAFYAVLNTCPHQLGPVCEGQLTKTVVADESTGWLPFPTLEGRVLRCPRHRLEFDVAGGECPGNPRYRVRTFPIVVDGDRLKVVVRRSRGR
jgi:nitrite reductase/ring-hydroxylating ferredoxin subunit